METVLGSEIFFSESALDANTLRLKSSDLDTIGSHMTQITKIVHASYRGGIRYNRRPIDDAVLVLTPLSVLGFVFDRVIPTRKKCITTQVPSSDGKKKGKPIMVEQVKEVDEPDPENAYLAMHLLFKFDLSSLDLIAYSKDKELLLKTPKDNVRLLNDGNKWNLAFGQLTYRNYQILFSAMERADMVEVKCQDMSLFPEIDVYMSPSQKFQFLYIGLCHRYEAVYHHDVVRFVHSLVVSGSSIVDLSQISIDLFGRYKSGYDLRPIFHALSLMDFVCGVCCSDTDRPNILEEMQFLLQKESKIKIVHLVNCNAQKGMKQLESVVGRRNKSPVRYWNLRNNKFEDFGAFLNVLHFSSEPLIFLDVSDCGITANDAGDLFQKFIDLPMLQQIQQLHIAGIELNPRAEGNFTAFMQILSKGQKSQLDTLDLSRIGPGLSSLLQALIDFPQPLVNLKITDVKIQDSQSDKLIRLIKESKTLRSLDLSKTYVNPESVVNVITAISSNPNLKGFELILDELSLTTGNLLPIFRVFLEGNLNTWRSISLCRNEMTADDLRNIIPLFMMMKKLRSLSLSGNFDSSMPNIGNVVRELLNIKSLRRINIAGSDTNKLRQELIPFITALKDNLHVTEVDISNNAIGDNGYMALLTTLRARKFASLKTDGSETSSIDLLSELPRLVSDSGCVSFEFPMKDGSVILKKLEGVALNDSLYRLTNIQLQINNALAANRSARFMLPQLPFQTTREIRKLIMEMTQASRKVFLENEKPLVHSIICQEFGLPLPYQKISDIVTDGGPIVKVTPTPALKVYKTPMFFAQVAEDKADYTAPDPSKVKIDESESSDSESDSEDDLMKSKRMRWEIVKQDAKKKKEQAKQSRMKREEDIDGDELQELMSSSEKHKKKGHHHKHDSSEEEEDEKGKKKSGSRRSTKGDTSTSDWNVSFDLGSSEKRKLRRRSQKKGDSSEGSSPKKRRDSSDSFEDEKHGKREASEGSPKRKDKHGISDSGSFTSEKSTPKKGDSENMSSSSKKRSGKKGILGSSDEGSPKKRSGKKSILDSSDEGSPKKRSQNKKTKSVKEDVRKKDDTEKTGKHTKRATLMVKHKKLLSSSDSEEIPKSKKQKQSSSSSTKKPSPTRNEKPQTKKHSIFSSSDDEDPQSGKRSDAFSKEAPAKKKPLFNLSSSSSADEPPPAPQPKRESKKKLLLSSESSDSSDKDIGRAQAPGELDELLDFSYKPERRPRRRTEEDEHRKGPVKRKPAPRLDPIARLPDHS